MAVSYNKLWKLLIDKNMKKKSGLIAGIVILILLCIGAGVLYQNMKPAASEGEKHITVTVIHGDQTENVFELWNWYQMNNKQYNRGINR